MVADSMEIQQIKNKIFEIRGLKVMMDFDLAELYGIETKRLKEAVRRNKKRFPPDFMMELTLNEWHFLRTQFASSKKGGTQYTPFAFTELGVAMLSSVLGSDTAIEINIGIMRAFVTVRQLLSSFPKEDIVTLQKELEKLKDYMHEVLTDQNDINEDARIQLDSINRSLAELQVDVLPKKVPHRRVGYVR
jgi:hypothetical protein